MVAAALAVATAACGFRAAGETPAEQHPAAVTTAEADSVEAMSPQEAAAALASGIYKAPDSDKTEKVEEASTAADFFVSAPLSVFPTIDPMTRMDMIDYFKAGSDKASKNLIGGECRILERSEERRVGKEC